MNLVERIAQRLPAHRYAALAATVIVARGQAFLDQDALAAQLVVPRALVRSWETGVCSPQHVPRRIRAVAPDLDWTAAGVTMPGDPTDPASRHPSSFRG